MKIEIIQADLTDSEQVSSVIDIVDSYAREPVGGSEPLAAQVRERLAIDLKSVPGLVVFLALLDAEPAGVAVCFRGYSTFNAKPLVNIHDLAVQPKSRNRGLGRALLHAIDDYAKATGCCKVTLEVRENNIRARRLYREAGFGDVGSGTEAMPTIFLEKSL
jgi:ribosomal protein S18 acetylase RimI-like enzyme